MLPVIVHFDSPAHGLLRQTTWALIDSGSNVDCVKASLVGQLGLKTHKVMTKISTLEKQASVVKEYCDFYVSSLDSSAIFEIEGAMVADNFQGPNERPLTDKDIEHLDYLVKEGVFFHDALTEEIGILLSTKKSWVWEGGRVVRGGADLPMAKETPLGWMLYGGEDKPRSLSAESTHHCIINQSVEDKFDLILRREFLTPDGKPVDPLKKHYSDEDRRALEQATSSLYFDEKWGKYTCNLPLKWDKDRTAELYRAVDSLSNARQRLMNGIKKMQKEPERAEAMEIEIRKMEEKGYCRKLE